MLKMIFHTNFAQVNILLVAKTDYTFIVIFTVIVYMLFLIDYLLCVTQIYLALLNVHICGLFANMTMYIVQGAFSFVLTDAAFALRVGTS